MGMAAERTAEAVGLSRADLDAFALESQRRATLAAGLRRVRRRDRARGDPRQEGRDRSSRPTKGRAATRTVEGLAKLVARVQGRRAS